MIYRVNKKKIAVFSGAGLDAMSGIATFRGLANSTWNNYNVDDVCTLDGWKKNRELVLDFYNERRRELPNVQPNDAHIKLVELEEDYDVTHITQNVTDLLERAGASKVFHLHGELTKAHSSLYNGDMNKAKEVYYIGYNDINIGDKCKKTDSQLRPYVVFFGEMPINTTQAYLTFVDTDVLVIIGTTLLITYTIQLLKRVKEGAKIYYIDPEPSNDLDKEGLDITYIKETADKGLETLKELLK